MTCDSKGIAYRQEQHALFTYMPKDEQRFRLCHEVRPYEGMDEIGLIQLSDNYIERELENLKKSGRSYENLFHLDGKVVLSEGVTKSLKYKNKKDIPIVVSVQHNFYKKSDIFAPDPSRNFIEIPGVYMGMEIPEGPPYNEYFCRVRIFDDTEADKLKNFIMNLEIPKGDKAFTGELKIWSPWELTKDNYVEGTMRF